ncbi:MAG: PDDEXK nuclease domain-containing protein [Bacteroidales bacterium]|nr:PDDEXK nuclease domain-containing protein [Bacteroidales bacterium]
MATRAEEKSFGEILGIIRTHRAGALVSVNVEHLLSRWEIGGYLSSKIKRDGWGQATIDRLVDYIHANAPEERGYGRRNLYNMVAVYEAFTAPDFAELVGRYGGRIVQPVAGQIVQSATAQLPVPGKVRSATGQIVQSGTAQIAPMPPVFMLTTFTNLVEILNRTRTAQERLFYIVYSFRERLNMRELRRRLVDDAYSMVLGGDKRNYSKALLSAHPAAPVIIPDSALVDFLHLPPKHSEARLRKGIVTNMKDFILSIGRDFLFMGEEYPVQVGGTDFRIDLLFYHRALRCLVAFELKAREFRPSDMGQLEFYLEALDRDVKRTEENPSIGVLLCKSADHSQVEYAISRTMSPALVAEYKRVMIPRDVLQRSFDLYLADGGIAASDAKETK